MVSFEGKPKGSPKRATLEVDRSDNHDSLYGKSVPGRVAKNHTGYPSGATFKANRDVLSRPAAYWSSLKQIADGRSLHMRATERLRCHL